MALTRHETQIQFSASNSVNLNDNNFHWSDAFSFDATDVNALLQFSADNSNVAPADGDTVEVKIAFTTGDLLGDTGDDFDTEEHASYLKTLDTYATNTPGEDPARGSVSIPVGAKGFKIGAKAAQGATRAITFRARVATQRAA